MCASDNEHQLKYLVYMLEQASKLAEKTGLLSVSVHKPFIPVHISVVNAWKHTTFPCQAGAMSLA